MTPLSARFEGGAEVSFIVHSTRLISATSHSPAPRGPASNSPAPTDSVRDVQDARLRVDEGRIARQGTGEDGGTPRAGDRIVDASAVAGQGALLTAGPIDIHVHGRIALVTDAMAAADGYGLNIDVVGEEGATLSVDIASITRATVTLGAGGVGGLRVPLNIAEYALSPMTVRYVPTSGSPIEVAGSSALVWNLFH